MTKSNTSRGKKNNAKNNQRDLSSDNVDATAEAKSDGIPEGDTPLPTDKQSKELPVSEPLQDIWTICNDACKFILFAVFHNVYIVLTEQLFYLVKSCYELWKEHKITAELNNFILNVKKSALAYSDDGTYNPINELFWCQLTKIIIFVILVQW